MMIKLCSLVATKRNHWYLFPLFCLLMMKSRRPRHKTSGDLSNKMRVRNAGVAQFNINYRKIGYMYKMMYSFWVEAEHVSLDLFCFVF